MQCGKLCVMAKTMATNAPVTTFKKYGYKQQLDGLRAPIILLVMAQHGAQQVQFPFVQSGFIGLDTFFVLSGYLITAIFLREIDATGKIRLGAFYMKRALRILPAIITVCLVVGSLWLLLPWAPLREETLWGVLATLTYTSNWFNALDLIDLGFLEHTWSLSVEEHFYLVWPFVLLLAIKMTGKVRATVVVVAGVAVAYSLTTSIVLGWSFDRIQNGSDTHAYPLLLGCLLAVLLNKSARVVGLLPAMVSAVFLLCLVVFMPWPSPFYTFGGTLLVSLGAMVIIAHLVTQPHSWMSKVFCLRPVVWIGKRSYGIYLWHVPIIAFLGATDLPVLPKMVLAISLSFVVPALSYHYIEKPFLIRKARYAATTTAT